jgi:DNA-binding MarR family transcriptional regulator
LAEHDHGLFEDAVSFDWALQSALRTRTRLLAKANAEGRNPRQLETGDVDTLDLISTSGESPMSTIAAGLHVDPSTATRAVDRLVERGLVTRRRDPADSRSVLVAFTHEGFAALAEARERRITRAMQLLRQFEPDEQDALGRLLPMVADAIATELNGLPAKQA